MTNDNRFKADEIILGLVSPPFLVLLLNLFRPFLGYSRIFNNESVYMDVENHHILGYWIWLWLIPYALLFVPEFKKGTSIMVQIPICLSASIAFWDVFVQEYSQG